MNIQISNLTSTVIHNNDNTKFNNEIRLLQIKNTIVNFLKRHTVSKKRVINKQNLL